MINKNITKLLLGVLFFFSFSAVQAQDNSICKDNIIGKWVLKSALLNGEDMSKEEVVDRISFEFDADGKVTLIYSNGKEKKGDFLIEGDRLIDPNTPEYLDAQIVSLSKENLILAMDEDQNRVIMKFELEVLE